MTMEFGDKAEHVVEHVEKAAKLTIIEGGAVAVGLMGASFLGRTIEGYIKPNVTKNSSTMDKLVAWGSNVVPKLGLYYALNDYGRAKEDKTVNLVVDDAKKAALASVFIDSAIRLSNGGVNTMSAKILGFDILNAGNVNAPNSRMTNVSADLQKVVQENSVLRGQLNQALQKLATSPSQQQVRSIPVHTSAQPAGHGYARPINVTPVSQPPVQPVQAAAPVVNVRPVSQPVQTAAPPIVRVTPVGNVPPDHDRKYGMMQTTPEAENRRGQYGMMDKPFAGEVEERERRYGAMESVPPAIDERNRQYNFMNKGKMKFAGETDNVAALYGML